MESLYDKNNLIKSRSILLDDKHRVWKKQSFDVIQLINIVDFAFLKFFYKSSFGKNMLVIFNFFTIIKYSAISISRENPSTACGVTARLARDNRISSVCAGERVKQQTHEEVGCVV